MDLGPINMGNTGKPLMPAMLILMGLFIIMSMDFTAAQIGVYYGRNGDNQISPPQVVDLYKRYQIRRMRIYEPFEPTLDALRGSGIELTVSVPNPDLPGVAASQASADAWVQKYIVSYPDVAFRTVVVGNEISPGSENAQSVFPAMQNVHNALAAANRPQIRVTTSIGTGVLAKSDPPEDGEFKPEVADYLRPIIGFLASNGYPIFASIYPYISYLNTPGMDIKYALLDPNYPGYTTRYQHTYQNLFYALVDSVNAAVDRVLMSSPELDAASSIPGAAVGESGVPSDGGGTVLGLDDDRGLTTTQNAQSYYKYLVQAVKKGTPLRPDHPIETYMFALFDENLKPDQDGLDEKHYGIFYPNGDRKLDVAFD